MYTGKGNNIALHKHCFISGKCNALNKTVFKIGTKKFVIYFKSLKYISIREPCKFLQENLADVDISFLAHEGAS